MRFPALEIDLLRAFTAVAETGSFTAAAEDVALTQAAVSQQVARLERTLDKRLFERTTRSLALTADGEALLGYARRIIDLNNEAVRFVTGESVTGKLRLGVCEDIIPWLLPRLLARFTAMHPGLELGLFTDLSTRLKERLGRGELDLAIAKRDPGNIRGGRVIWREPLVWFAARDFVLSTKAPLPLVLLPQPCSYRRLALESLQQAGVDYRIVCTSHSIMGLQAAVAGGVGISVLGRSFIQQGLRETPPGELPELPQTEIAVFGETAALANVATPLVEFLLDGLSAGR